MNDWKKAFFWQISCKDSLAYYLPYKGFCVLFLSCGWFMGFAPWIGFDVPESGFFVVCARHPFLAGMLFSCKLKQVQPLKLKRFCFIFRKKFLFFRSVSGVFLAFLRKKSFNSVYRECSWIVNTFLQECSPTPQMNSIPISFLRLWENFPVEWTVFCGTFQGNFW